MQPGALAKHNIKCSTCNKNSLIVIYARKSAQVQRPIKCDVQRFSINVFISVSSFIPRAEYVDVVALTTRAMNLTLPVVRIHNVCEKGMVQLMTPGMYVS